MSDTKNATESDKPAASKSGGFLPFLAIGMISGVLGAATPFVISLVTSSNSAQAQDDSEDSEDAHGSSEHGPSSKEKSSQPGHHGGAEHGGSGGGHGTQSTEQKHSSKSKSTAKMSDMVYLPFGDVTVNLDEQRLNRYLRVKISLQVRKSDASTVENAIAEREQVLRNWLLAHLSDKDLNEIRGKVGQNMLRREIRDYFNIRLFPDRIERIDEVLFLEFNVQ